MNGSLSFFHRVYVFMKYIVTPIGILLFSYVISKPIIKKIGFKLEIIEIDFGYLIRILDPN